MFHSLYMVPRKVGKQCLLCGSKWVEEEQPTRTEKSRCATGRGPIHNCSAPGANAGPYLKQSAANGKHFYYLNEVKFEFDNSLHLYLTCWMKELDELKTFIFPQWLEKIYEYFFCSESQDSVMYKRWRCIINKN